MTGVMVCLGYRNKAISDRAKSIISDARYMYGLEVTNFNYS